MSSSQRSLVPAAGRASALVIAGLVCCLAASTAHARSLVYVASTGTDTNRCTRSKPCRHLQKAIKRVASGGEVVALDSADYGPIVISKSVTISADAVHAAIIASSGAAVSVNGPASGAVVLRHLSIEQGGAAGTGVTIQSGFAGGSLLLEDCHIQGFTIGVNQLSDSSVVLRRTIIQSPLSGTGVVSAGVSALADVTLEGSSVQGGGVGLSVGSDAKASVVDSTFLGCTTRAIDSSGAPFHTTHVSIDRCGFDGNGIAIASRGGSAGVSVVEYARSAIIANGTAFEVDAGQTLASRGDNTVLSNTTGKIGTGTLTAFSPQ